MSIWRDRSVGTRAFTILIADWLSQYKVVGPDCSKPSSFKIERRYLACLAVRTAARNSASVELVAVIDWVLQRYEMTPPLRTKAYPVVDRRFLKSLPCAASYHFTLQISISSGEGVGEHA